MVTIKSYSDLQQSKKLAKILPLESADMYYWCADHYPKEDWIIEVGAPDDNYECIRAWSLVALLDVLPKNLNIGRPALGSNYMGYYWLQYYDEYMKPNNYKTKCLSNPVDACYEMILKLHELNLL